MKIYIEVLKPECLDLLRKVQKAKEFEQFYLVGGTALALQLGHRESIDIDLFTQDEFSHNILKFFPSTYTLHDSYENYIEIFSDNIKVEFLYFAFELTQPLIEVEGIKMIDPIDIGLFKLMAIQRRMTKKDIIDLYFIDKNFIRLEELLDKFESVEQYRIDSFSSYSSIRKIFDDEIIRKSPNPKMLVDIEFEEVYKQVKDKIMSHIHKMIC